MASTSPPTSAPRKKPLLSRTSTAVKSSGKSAVSGSATKKKGRKNLPFFLKKTLDKQSNPCYNTITKREHNKPNLKEIITMTTYFVNYTIKTALNSKNGWASYENENEMYADLEAQGITEDNKDVRFLQFFEVLNVNGKNYIVNSWM